MNQVPYLLRKSRYIPHYHGDTVRKLFVAAGVVLLLALPLFREMLGVSTLTFIIGVVVLIIFAALTNPMQRWVNVIDVIISAAGVVVFEVLAVSNYTADGIPFYVSQTLAILFLFALYFSARTARAMATGQFDPTLRKEKAPLDEAEEKSNEELIDDISRGHGY